MIGVWGAVAAGIAAIAITASSVISSNAQKDVAETNAKATVNAAKEAARAQIESSANQMKSDIFRSKTEKERDELYFSYQRQADDKRWEQEKSAALDKNAVQSAVLYAETLPWGEGSAVSYDYGEMGGKKGYKV